jgi:hypothetical protein
MYNPLRQISGNKLHCRVPGHGIDRWKCVSRQNNVSLITLILCILHRDAFDRTYKFDIVAVLTVRINEKLMPRSHSRRGNESFSHVRLSKSCFPNNNKYFVIFKKYVMYNPLRQISENKLHCRVPGHGIDRWKCVSRKNNVSLITLILCILHPKRFRQNIQEGHFLRF